MQMARVIRVLHAMRKGALLGADLPYQSLLKLVFGLFSLLSSPLLDAGIL